jgi:RNA polymerase sigma-70 factor (ECF subfamily)
MADLDRIEEKTDEELAREAQAGSGRSFEELARRYKRRLFVYLRSRVGSDQDAEDMVQDTFLKLYRNIGGYDPAYRFTTWLYTSANRLAIDSHRKKAVVITKVDVEDLGDLPEPAARISAETGATGLWDAARGLGESRFRVLWLRYGEDLSIEEIAAVLGRTRLAVRVLLHRARAALIERVDSGTGRVKAFEPGVAEETVGE